MGRGAGGKLNVAARTFLLTRPDGSFIALKAIEGLIFEGDDAPPMAAAVTVASLAPGRWTLVDRSPGMNASVPFVIEPGRSTTVRVLAERATDQTR